MAAGRLGAAFGAIVVVCLATPSDVSFAPPALRSLAFLNCIIAGVFSAAASSIAAAVAATCSSDCPGFKTRGCPCMYASTTERLRSEWCCCRRCSCCPFGHTAVGMAAAAAEAVTIRSLFSAWIFLVRNAACSTSRFRCSRWRCIFASAALSRRCIAFRARSLRALGTPTKRLACLLLY